MSPSLCRYLLSFLNSYELRLVNLLSCHVIPVLQCLQVSFFFITPSSAPFKHLLPASTCVCFHSLHLHFPVLTITHHKGRSRCPHHYYPSLPPLPAIHILPSCLSSSTLFLPYPPFLPSFLTHFLPSVISSIWSSTASLCNLPSFCSSSSSLPSYLLCLPPFLPSLPSASDAPVAVSDVRKVTVDSLRYFSWIVLLCW